MCALSLRLGSVHCSTNKATSQSGYVGKFSALTTVVSFKCGLKTTEHVLFEGKHDKFLCQILEV